LPDAKKKRFIQEYGLSPEIADVLTNEKPLAAWTEEVISELDAWITANGDEAARQEKRLSKTAANWIVSELLKHLNIDGKKISELKISAENFAQLVCLIYQDKINSSAAQSILEKMYETGADPIHLMTELGLEQMDNSAELEEIINQIILDSPDQVNQYKSGKTNIIQFLVGKTMAASGGKANPKIVRDLLEKILN